MMHVGQNCVLRDGRRSRFSGAAHNHEGSGGGNCGGHDHLAAERRRPPFLKCCGARCPFGGGSGRYKLLTCRLGRAACAWRHHRITEHRHHGHLPPSGMAVVRAFIFNNHTA